MIYWKHPYLLLNIDFQSAGLQKLRNNFFRETPNSGLLSRVDNKCDYENS